MAELPERFDSKRELDAWLARVVDTYTKYTGPDNAIQNPLEAKEYTTKREHALDLLEEFCEEYDLRRKFQDDLVMIKTPADSTHVNKFLVHVEMKNKYCIDPLSVSVAIYKAFHQLEEKYK